MWYNLKNPLEIDRFKDRVTELRNKGAMVELTEKKARSLRSNAYLHTILSYFGLQTGNTLAEVKELYYKRVCNQDLFVRTKWDNVLKTNREYLRSTTELTQEEMSLSIDRFRTWSAQTAEIYIPSSEEYIALLHIQHDLEQNKQYL